MQSEKYVGFFIKLMLLLSICIQITPQLFGVEMSSKSSKRENIAVLDFEGKNMSSSEASIFADFIRTELVKTGVFNVVEKKNLDKILKEVNFQQSGATSAEDAVKLGNMLNVRKIIFGSVAKLSEKYFITANLVDVESSKIDKSETLKCDSVDEFPSLASSISERYSGVILLERMSVQERIQVDIIPKFGFILPLDSTVSKNHGVNLAYGLNVVFWSRRSGLGIEYDQSQDAKEIPKNEILYLDPYASLFITGTNVAKEELVLRTLAINYFYKFKSAERADFFYIGPGFGNIWVATNIKNGGAIDQFVNPFPLLQCNFGYRYKKIGFNVKYTYAPSNSDWRNVNFGGLYLTFNYYISTVMNLL